MVKKNRAGYTLIEVLVVVAILGIMSGVGANLILQVNRIFIMTRSRSDLQRESRGAMYIVTRELRQAVSSSIVIDRASTAQPFYSRITFTTLAGTTYTFYQNGNLLCEATKATGYTIAQGCKVTGVGANSSQLSNHVGYLAFTFPRSDDLTIMSVSMTLTENIYQGRVKSLHMASEKVQVMN
jgi:prepilin-type N-terminal cleavage/methylation domain-containing protein